MENLLFIFITFSFLALMASHVYFTNAFFMQLQQQHANVWKALGRPKWKIHFGDDSYQKAMKYIRKKEFKILNDSELELIYTKMKRIEYAGFAFALIIMIATFIDISH